MVRAKGFTLIEMVVVMVILLLLLAAGVPLASGWSNSSSAQHAASLLKQAMGMAKAKFEERNVGCLLVDAPANYVIPEMVVCRNARQYARWRSAPCGDKRQYLQACLQKALQRQADFLGLKLQVQQPEIICFGQERVIPKVRRSPANAFVRVASVEFTLPLVLHGHWAAGSLINRGFGVIFEGKNVEQP